MHIHLYTCTILCANMPHYMHPEFPANDTSLNMNPARPMPKLAGYNVSACICM